MTITMLLVNHGRSRERRAGLLNLTNLPMASTTASSRETPALNPCSSCRAGALRQRSVRKHITPASTHCSPQRAPQSRSNADQPSGVLADRGRAA